MSMVLHRIIPDAFSSSSKDREYLNTLALSDDDSVPDPASIDNCVDDMNKCPDIQRPASHSYLKPSPYTQKSQCAYVA